MIRKIENKDIPKLINYNTKTFNDRDKVEESIFYRFNYNPFITNSNCEILIVEDENKNIVGQALLMPTEFFYNGNVYPAYWEMDYVVDESFRGFAGVVLAKEALKVKNHFGMGLTNVSLAMHLAFGTKITGYMTKYLRLNNIFSIFRFLFINKKYKEKTFIFPKFINGIDGKFVRIYNPEEIISNDGYWNADLIEFSRCRKFIYWRFFHYKDKYFVYKYFPDKKVVEEKPTYFVVRPIVWEKVNCLLLVDYRFSINHVEMFDEIIKSTLNLTRKLKMAAVITGCSLPSLNRKLRKKWFFKFGDKLVVVTKFFNNKENPDLKKDTILVTFADSDCDFYYGNDRW